MSKLPQISEAEFEVMKIVWKYAPISTNDITDRLTRTTAWSPKTIQTLIKRLVTKKALTYEKQSRVFIYTPLVAESEYISQESNTFLKRFVTVQNPLGELINFCTKQRIFKTCFAILFR
ncbi:BlaI/MecI/CopY family transcriptional regulator [Hespellia stercorisuis]|uniref:BlaI family transcriptional regulator, penicillinase repressor n=1 Tax=Hespellia stercorisuis DSM 15480 TaxID=1121950 RepID=A0A1M6MZZ9_9FIRM|nr:BlaI/MecI/CopY family transcriptional regulator [Hespellia stercorisuis]SHJ89077.1 BlaI family transcriptional regulator, penicillinase repressor [Hespellia stercorisuis DSM 15480]